MIVEFKKRIAQTTRCPSCREKYSHFGQVTLAVLCVGFKIQQSLCQFLKKILTRRNGIESMR